MVQLFLNAHRLDSSWKEDEEEKGAIEASKSHSLLCAVDLKDLGTATVRAKFEQPNIADHSLAPQIQ